MVQDMKFPDVRFIGWWMTNIESKLLNHKKYDIMEYVTWGKWYVGELKKQQQENKC